MQASDPLLFPLASAFVWGDLQHLHWTLSEVTSRLVGAASEMLVFCGSCDGALTGADSGSKAVFSLTPPLPDSGKPFNWLQCDLAPQSLSLLVPGPGACQEP